MKLTVSQSTTIFWIGTLCFLMGAAVVLQQADAMSLVDQVEQLDQSYLTNGNKAPITLAVIENPEVVARVLASLLRSIIYSAGADFKSTQRSVDCGVELLDKLISANHKLLTYLLAHSDHSSEAQKRGLDLGISRGFSGSQAGKHLLGLSAASFANGPGR